MAAYSGKFQYLDEKGALLNQGPCQFRFDAETAILTPSSGTPVAFDLGDVERITPAEWEFQLTLFTGKRIDLRRFGSAFGNMSQALVAAWRDRTVRCLLLEDLEEVARYTAMVSFKGPPAAAEIRLYKSNIAVLPVDGLPVQWRLAEVESVVFDDATYNVVLQSGGDRLSIGKLAKKTDEFRGNLAEALDALHTHEAEVLHATFPFLNPDQLQRLIETMPEGRSVSLAALRAIHPKLPDALIERAVDEPLKPYFDALRKRSVGDSLMTGFKFVRPDEAAPEAEEGPEETDSTEEKQPLFFWFFFPLANGRVAWEATTGSGRATYFFDAPAPVEQSIAHLTRGLALVNFRREPVYLPDDSLDLQPRFHRYAIGARKLPDLRTLRAAFRGRAIHSDLEAWTAQADRG